MSRASQRHLASWLNAGVRPPAEAAFPLSITVGPFHLAVIHAPRDTMRVQRRLMEYELSHGIVWLHESLTGERLAHQFLKAIIRLIHKSAGCQTGCIEEAFTQSLAAGLVSFAQHNPEVWVWFNRLLGESVKRGPASSMQRQERSTAAIAFPRRFSSTGMSCASSRCAIMRPCVIRSMAISAKQSLTGRSSFTNACMGPSAPSYLCTR